MDYQPIVDEIRSFVQSVDQTLTDRIKEVASLYAQACNEVNQRLRRCDEFLQKGLRSEAVHLAETEPAVLDQLAILDFAERPQWEELALTYGLPAPPQLRLETAAALNEAYADEQPLEELLRKHRLLALTRGSLKGRISVMRRIAELDPGNTVWPDDIRHFEKHRFQQIQNDLSALAGHEDYDGLVAIATELQTTRWLTVPPSALVKQVENTKNRFRKGWASNTLRALEGELNEAINTFDLAKARQLRDKWNFIAKDAELPEDDPILERAALAFEWLKEQDVREANQRAFQDHLDELENALNKRAERALLDQAYHSAKQYGREIPPMLESRYHDFVAEEENNRNRKRKLVRAAILTGSVLLMAIIVYSFYQSYQTKKLEDAVASLEKMIDGDQIAEARVFLDNLTEKDNHTANQPQVVSIKTKLIALEKKEQERARRFQQALQEAQAEAPELLKSPAIEKAESLARRPREWDAIERVVEKRRELIQQAKTHSKEAFEERINELTKQVRKLEDLPSNSRSSLAAKNLLSKLHVEFTQLRPDSQKYGQALHEQVESLATRLESVRFSMERNQQQLDFEYKLSATLLQPKDFENYFAALADYRKEFPNIKRSADFEIACKEKPLLQGVLKWSEIASTIPNGPFNLEPEERKTLTDNCRNFLKVNPDYANADLVDSCLKCLDAVSQRDERVQGSAAHDLRNLFEDFLVKDLWMAKTKDGKRYYSRKRIAFAGADVSFSRLTGFDGKEQGTTLIGKNVEEVSPAPQSLLSEQICKRLPAGSREAIWIEAMRNITQMILDDSDIDPILKLVLVKKTIAYAGRGSYPLSLALQEHQRYLEKAGANLEAPWMNPDDSPAKEARPKAADVLAKFPTLESVPKKALAEQQKIGQHILQSRRTLIGWLARGDSGWECRSLPSTPEGELTLYVLMRDAR